MPTDHHGIKMDTDLQMIIGVDETDLDIRHGHLRG